MPNNKTGCLTGMPSSEVLKLLSFLWCFYGILICYQTYVYSREQIWLMLMSNFIIYVTDISNSESKPVDILQIKKNEHRIVLLTK